MRSHPGAVRIARYAIIALVLAAIYAPLAHSGELARVWATFALRLAGAESLKNVPAASLLVAPPKRLEQSASAPIVELPLARSAANGRDESAVRTSASAPMKPAAPAGTPTSATGAAVGPIKTDLAKSGLKPSAAKKPAAPLSVSVKRASTGSPEDGLLTIKGGTAPFTVQLVGDYAPLELYKGSNRKIPVPILAGPTQFRVTDSTVPSGPSGGYSFAAADPPSAEATISGDTKFWVMNTTNRMLRRYDAATDTMTVNVWVRGADTTSAVGVSSIAVRQSDDHVFVVFGGNINVDPFVNRLIELDASGAVVATITVPYSRKIQDVTFDKNDDIFVCDRGTGYGTDNRVRIVKLDHNPPYDVIETTQTVLPNNPYIGYPMANTTNMLDYQPVADKIIARINSGTFAVINPSTLAIEQYRYSEDYAYTCMALNTSNEASVTLYTGGSGFYRPPFFGKQSGFLNEDKYKDQSIITSPSAHDWIVAPTLPAITDVAIDSNDYVYTIQSNMASATTRAYIVNPDGAAVKDIDLPGGTKIAVVQNDGIQTADHNADITGSPYEASMNTGCFGCHYADLRKEHGDQVLQSMEDTAGAYRSMLTTPSGTFAQSSTTDDRCNVCHNDKLNSSAVTMPAGKFNESYNTTVAAIVNKGSRYSTHAKRCDGCHYSTTGTDGPQRAHVQTTTVTRDVRYGGATPTSSTATLTDQFTAEFRDWSAFNPTVNKYWGGHVSGSMTSSSQNTTIPAGAAYGGITYAYTTAWKGAVDLIGFTDGQYVECDDCHSYSSVSRPNGPQGAAVVINMDPNFPTPWKSAAQNATAGTNGAQTICAKCHRGVALAGSYHSAGSLPTGHGNQQCTACHLAIPHAWKRPRLLLNRTNDAAPYENEAVVGLVGVNPAGSQSKDQWDRGDCNATACGGSQHSLPAANMWP